MAALGSNSTVTHLDIYRAVYHHWPSVGNALASALVCNRTLRSLALGSCGGQEGLVAVLSALGGPEGGDGGTCSSVTRLDLFNVEMNEEAMRALGASIARGLPLEQLGARRSKILPEGMWAFAREVTARGAVPPRLRDLRLCCNEQLGLGGEMPPRIWPVACPLGASRLACVVASPPTAPLILTSPAHARLK